MNELQQIKSGLGSVLPPRPRAVAVLGLGQAGINVLDQIVLHGTEAIDSIAVDTDQQVIEASVAQEKILLGARLTRGLGCTGDLVRGFQVWRNEVQSMDKILRGRQEVILLAGLGGGTGSAFVVEAAKLARTLGLKVIVACFMPYSFETSMRQEISRRILSELREVAEVVISLANERSLAWPTSRENIRQSFLLLNRLLAQGVGALSQILQQTGLTPLEFADLQKLYGSAHRGDLQENCWIGSGEIEASQGVAQLLEQAMGSPLLNDPAAWMKADSCLACLSGGRDLDLADLQKLTRLLENRLGGRMTVQLGARLDQSYQGRMRLNLLMADTKGVFMPEKIEEPELPVPSTAPSSGQTALHLAVPVLAEEVKPVEAATIAKLPPEKRFRQKPKVEPVIELPVQSEETALPAPAPSVPIPVYVRKIEPETGRKKSSKQEELPFDNGNRGRFDKSFETIYRGENLDQPTFRRKKLAIKL